MMLLTKYTRSATASLAVILATGSLAACNNGAADPEPREGTTADSEGDAQEPPQESTVQLTLGHVQPESDPQAQAVSRFADAVEELTDGSVTIEVYPAGQLGGELDILEGLELGTTDMWFGGAGSYNAMSDVGQFFVTPFMFESVNEAMAAYDGALGDAIRERLDEETATVLVDLWARGPRHITANKAIETPDDLRGVLLRTPENPMFIEAFESFGASPTPMAFPEVFTALQQGTIDGQENPLALIQSSGFAEVQSHLNLTGHVIEPLAIVIADQSWEALSDQQQEAIRQASSEVGDEFQQEVNSEEDRLRAELEAAGMTVVQPDVAAFQEAAQPVREGAGAPFSDLYDLVDAE